MAKAAFALAAILLSPSFLDSRSFRPNNTHTMEMVKAVYHLPPFSLSVIFG
jgi:hypothetical protein